MGQEMKRITKEMLKIYVPISGLDWMNYRIIKDADLSFHHIVKKSEGGKEITKNGALLIAPSHNYLHSIEYKDKDTYVTLNKLFQVINKQMHEPTMEQRWIIEQLLLEFEEKHVEDRNAKGQIFIKEIYKHRW